MGSYVYMGVRGAEHWFKAPAPRTPFQAVGWSSTTRGRNGLLTGVHSRATHMRYELSWPTVSTEQGRQVEDWFYGLEGDGLIHWLDPMIRNHAPVAWSYPALGCTDGAPIYGIERPSAVNTSANSKGLPRKSAVFSAVGLPGYTPPKLYIPIPPGYKAVVSALRGSAGTLAASGVVARTVIGTTPIGAETAIPLIGANVAGVGGTTFTQTGSITGIEIRLALGEVIGGTTQASSITLAGLMVQVVPAGAGSGSLLAAYERGGGNAGCRMFEPPMTTPISAYRGRTSVSAILEEVAQ